jgi:hypothetical protein
MNPQIALALIILLMNPLLLPAVDGHKAMYAGGTIARFNNTTEQLQGRVDIDGERELVFIPDTTRSVLDPLRIEFEAIRDLEFGQKVGRRMTLVTGTTVLLGPFGLLSLLSKSRAHYLTVAYADDDGKIQVAVFELGKRTARATLATIEARSRVGIEYQDQAARKWSR